MSNVEISRAMTNHHAEMVNALEGRIDLLVSSTENWQEGRNAVVSYLLNDVLPHAEAEESTIYSAALQFVRLTALVRSMMWEHTIIRELTQALQESIQRDHALMLAMQVSKLFWVHAEKENRYVIADLAPEPDIDLHAILGAMHDALAG